MSKLALFFVLWVVITLLAVDQTDISQTPALIACVVTGALGAAMATALVALIQKIMQ